MSAREEMFRRLREGEGIPERAKRLWGIDPRPAPIIRELTPEEEEYRGNSNAAEKARRRLREAKMPKRISLADEADYRRALKPSAEILRQAAKGNEQAREIVRLATDRSPASGGQRRRLTRGTAWGFCFSFPGPTYNGAPR